MKTKWTALGICALVAFVMTGFCGCGGGNSDEQAEPEAGETVDMDDGVNMEFVNIPDSNADHPAEDCPDGVGFTGEMSRYPTTNVQYAEYLNEALASGDVIVDGNQVKGTTGDYAGQNYYRLDGAGYTGVGATNGGASRISYSDGVFSVDSGFENHPVTYVSWYGATAFAEYYGWRLPTEWEWESVANYNDNRAYAPGGSLTVADPSGAPESGIAREHNGVWYLSNYRDYQAAEYGTTPVGHFGYFGYGLAGLSGNVWEWTSTVSGSYRVIRGGSWDGSDGGCAVSHRYNLTPGYQYNINGFRVCR